MAKKKGHDGGHLDESWLIPYADVLTLLLALFIVLFSSSSLDLEKYQQLMGAFYSEFHPLENMGGSGGNFLPEEWADLDPPQGTAITPPPSAEEAGGAGGGGQGGSGNAQISPLFNSIFKYIENNALGQEMQVRIDGESLLLTLTSDIWFPSGSAAISASQGETARKLAALIEENYSTDTPFEIVITGHTDNVPINTAQYRSNWYLSATRAINFMEVILQHSNLDPRMFSARGYGEYEPIDDNGTTEGRMHNRRVEVLISVKK